jgi:hypothetical protein
MKGSAITGPVGKEAAELWPVSATYNFFSPTTKTTCPNIYSLAYCQQLRCRHVRGCNEEGGLLYSAVERGTKKDINEQVPPPMRSYRSVEIFSASSFSPLPDSLFFFLTWGRMGGEEDGKVKSLDWQALAFRLRRVRMIQYQVSHQTDKEKKYPSPSRLN